MFLHRLNKTKAPELIDDLTWLNSKPLTLNELRGKVILLDFWTYSCVNCIRTFPHISRWFDLYKDKNLQIIGIHTPEFAFEKDQAYVKQALQKYNIQYPIVLDNDYKIWKSYQNKWWPRHFIIDSHGYIIHDHIGEGGYAETEHAIQKALIAIGEKDLPPIPPDESLGGQICYPVTPELYLGYARGAYGNETPIIPHSENSYTDLGNRKEAIPYLNGHFKVEAEYIENTRNIPSFNEYIALKYGAFAVNIVIDPNNNLRSELKVDLNGQPISEDMAGEDIIFKSGQSYLKLDSPRMYSIIKAQNFHRGDLRLGLKDSNLRFYALTFNGCQ